MVPGGNQHDWPPDRCNILWNSIAPASSGIVQPVDPAPGATVLGLLLFFPVSKTSEPSWSRIRALGERRWQAPPSCHADHKKFLSTGRSSSRRPTKVQCLRCPASVHSTKATWQTNFGLTHRHRSIFSAVNDSSHRQAPFSGRFLKGHWAVWRSLRARKRSSRIRDTNPFFTFAMKIRSFLS